MRKNVQHQNHPDAFFRFVFWNMENWFHEVPSVKGGKDVFVPVIASAVKETEKHKIQTERLAAHTLIVAKCSFIIEM